MKRVREVNINGLELWRKFIMIIKVSEKNIQQAAEIHSISWKDSHKDFCNKESIEKHTVENQRIYLSAEERTKELEANNVG